MKRNPMANMLCFGLGLLAVCVLPIACTVGPTEVAGNGGAGSETTNGVVAGIVRDAGGEPLANTFVSLHEHAEDYSLDLRIVDTTRSGDQGTYRFEHVAQGLYKIRALSADSSQSVVIDSVEVVVKNDTVTIEARTRASASIETTWPYGSHFSRYIALYRNPWAAVANNAGVARLTGVPEGTYLLQYILHDPLSGGRGVTFAESVTVTTDTPTITAAQPTRKLGSGVGRVVFDDFELAWMRTVEGEGWWSFTDSSSGGNSVVTGGTSDSFLVSPGYGDTGQCARFSFTFGSRRVGKFVGFGTFLGVTYANQELLTCKNVADVDSMSLALKGTGARVAVSLKNDLTGEVVPLIKIDSLPDVWTRYSVDFTALAAADTSSAYTWEQKMRYMTRFHIQSTSEVSGETGTVWVDDIVFFYNQ
ncbi:MAG: DUF1416 domain-containing protein [Chitinivibrionales bacterium]|nr:DUF1416 domain-containing protein [Chitinivibrionales bacterium]